MSCSHVRSSDAAAAPVGQRDSHVTRNPLEDSGVRRSFFFALPVLDRGAPVSLVGRSRFTAVCLAGVVDIAVRFSWSDADTV